MQALSISRPIREQLAKACFSARVLTVFDHSCDLVTPGGDVIALVCPTVGNGPLNIVVDARPGAFARLNREDPAGTSVGQLQVGCLDIYLDNITEWEPRPDWMTLRAMRPAIETRLPDLLHLAQQFASPESLLAPWLSRQDSVPGTAAVQSICREFAARRNGGWKSALDLAGQVAGLGIGLTPAGDDFLSGSMLRAWLAHPDPGNFCQEIVKVTAPRTTTLSAAFLKCAAKGECAAAWHQLLAALSAGRQADLTPAVRSVLAHGATSGADMLAGFCWPEQNIYPQPQSGV